MEWLISIQREVNSDDTIIECERLIPIQLIFAAFAMELSI